MEVACVLPHPKHVREARSAKGQAAGLSCLYNTFPAVNGLSHASTGGKAWLQEPAGYSLKSMTQFRVKPMIYLPITGFHSSSGVLKPSLLFRTHLFRVSSLLAACVSTARPTCARQRIDTTQMAVFGSISYCTLSNRTKVDKSPSTLPTQSLLRHLPDSETLQAGGGASARAKTVH